MAQETIKEKSAARDIYNSNCEHKIIRKYRRIVLAHVEAQTQKGKKIILSCVCCHYCRYCSQFHLQDPGKMI